MTIAQYIRIKKSQEQIIDKAKRIIEWAYAESKKVAFPKKTRPAIATDIKVGNIIWYKHEDNHPPTYWKEVVEVQWPDDPFKAFVAEDGSRYGLDDAFVEL